MTDQIVVEIATQALLTAGKISAPILLTALFVGVFMGLIQSVTQIQEQTLSFVPKFIAVGAVIALGSWMIAELVTLCTQLFEMAESSRDDRPCLFPSTSRYLSVFAGKCAHWYVAVHRSPVWSHYSCPCSWRACVRTRTSYGIGDRGRTSPGIVQLAAAALFKAAIGLATGFIVLAFISVFSVAGAFVDFSGGFSMGAMLTRFRVERCDHQPCLHDAGDRSHFRDRRPHCSCGWLHAHLPVGSVTRALD